MLFLEKEYHFSIMYNKPSVDRAGLPWLQSNSLVARRNANLSGNTGSTKHTANKQFNKVTDKRSKRPARQTTHTKSQHSVDFNDRQPPVIEDSSASSSSKLVIIIVHVYVYV